MDGLSFEHFSVTFTFLDNQGVTGFVHDKSPHQTQAFLSKLRHGHVFPSWVNNNYPGSTACAFGVVDVCW